MQRRVDIMTYASQPKHMYKCCGRCGPSRQIACMAWKAEISARGAQLRAAAAARTQARATGAPLSVALLLRRIPRSLATGRGPLWSPPCSEPASTAGPLIGTPPTNPATTPRPRDGLACRAGCAHACASDLVFVIAHRTSRCTCTILIHEPPRGRRVHHDPRPAFAASSAT